LTSCTGQNRDADRAKCTAEPPRQSSTVVVRVSIESNAVEPTTRRLMGLWAFAGWIAARVRVVVMRLALALGPVVAGPARNGVETAVGGTREVLRGTVRAPGSGKRRRSEPGARARAGSGRATLRRSPSRWR